MKYSNLKRKSHVKAYGHVFKKRATTRKRAVHGYSNVSALASLIANMSDQQVRERYHELVDKRPDLNALERFELERIELRLDAEDRDPVLETREQQWQLERTELLNSVEDLLVKLKSLSF
jgi:hypothetical protein